MADETAKVIDFAYWKEEHGDDGADDRGGGGGGPPSGPGGAGPSEEAQPVRSSEDAVALALAEKLAGGWRYVGKWNHWLSWEGTHWAFDEQMQIYTKARLVCREAARELDQMAQALTRAKAAGGGGAGGGEIKPSATLKRNLNSARAVNAVVSLARTDRRIATRHDVWDVDPWLLNTPAGVVDLRTGQMMAPDPARLMMHLAGATPEGACPDWFKFLQDVTGGDHAYQDYLQRLVGYSLTGSCEEEMFAFLHGPSNTGKSKFVETIRLLHGTYSAAAPMDSFTATKGERHPTDLAGFVGKRLITAAETEEGRRWDQQRLTTLTGRDPVSARFMRGDFFEYLPQFTLLFHGNYRPRLGSADPSMRRRLHLLPFHNRPAKIDRGLIDKFQAQLGGILIWAIEGAVLWRQHGLMAPAIITDATDQYFEAENILQAWIDERCSLALDAKAITADLYRDYSGWAKAAGEFVLTRRRFADLLEGLFGLKRWRKPGTGSRGFQGIALLSVGSLDF